MTRIVERARALLPAALHAVVQARMEEGRDKYGQELDEWPGTPRRAAIMRLQELLDGINYALFEDDQEGARADADQAARILERWPDLTPEEISAREVTLPPMSSSPTPLAAELDRVYRACQALAANIAEFGAITDPEFIDDVDAALDCLLLPELGRKMENSAALLNTFSVELTALHEKKVAGTDTEGDHTAFLEARDAMLNALLAPVDPGFCACQGFQACVDLGVIRHASRQLLNTATGALRTVHYFHLGPDGEKGVIIERCPSCGRAIKVNQEALAAIAGEEGHA